MTLLVRLAAIGLTGIALGCAAASNGLHHEWTKSGATPEDLARDRYNCTQDAGRGDPGSLASLNTGASSGARVTSDDRVVAAHRRETKALFEECMALRGWR